MRYIIIILAILMLYGCTGGDQTTTTSDPFVGGTTGLKLDFVEGAPPKEAYDKGTFPFDVAVQLENVGETNVNKADIQVTISGFDPTDFSKTQAFMSQNSGEDLRGTYKNSENRVIEGTISTVEFNGFSYMENLTGNTPFFIRADVCYKYGTTANTKLCYRENILDPEEDNDLCEINADKKVYNSGSPVQVENFKETGRGTNKIGFNFDIKHKGTGEIFDPGTTCDDSDRKFEDVIYVTVDTGMGGGLDCSSLDQGTKGSVKMYDNHKTVSCVQEVNDPADFEKPVVITLEFDYEEDKTEEIMIKHAVN